MKINKDNISNLMEAMKRDIMGGFHKPPSSILNSGWKRIPALEKFELGPAVLNTLLKLTIDVNKVIPRTIEVQLTRQNRMNRYIEHQIRRAKKAMDEGNTERYWKIAITSVQQSTAFRTSAYNRVFPGWWFKESWSTTWRKLQRIDIMIREWDDNLAYKRVYIPKTADTFRPLGVPSDDWRVVMHMWNNWLVMFLKDRVNEWNHAYQPGQGTQSAWRAVIQKVLKAKNIYEFDLEKFFDNTEINVVTDILQKAGVPMRFVYYLENINRCTPDLPKEELVDESVIKDRKRIHATLKQGIVDPELSIWEFLSYEENIPVYEQLCKEDGYDNLYEWAQAQWAAFDSISPSGMGDAFKGLPQGLNTSPILSIVTLEKWKNEVEAKGINLLMYADDGLMYSEKDFSPKGAFNEKKSKWLKRNGKWEVEEFKFLGLIYDVRTGLIRGATRKGSTLEIDTKRMGLFELLKLIREEAENRKSQEGETTFENFSQIHNWSNLDHLAASGMLGLVQSKLYGHTWEELKWPEQEQYISKHSWFAKGSIGPTIDPELYKVHRRESSKSWKDRGGATISTSACGYLNLLCRLAKEWTTERKKGKLSYNFKEALRRRILPGYKENSAKDSLSPTFIW